MFEEDYRELAEKVLAEVREADENHAAKLADQIQEICEGFVEQVKSAAATASEEEGASNEEENPEEADEEGTKGSKEPDEVV